MSKKACCFTPILCLAVLVALFFTLPFGLGLVFRDDALVDTSDFDLQARIIPDEENGYFDFENFTGEDVSENFVESELEDYAYLYEAVESAAKKDFFQDPGTADPAQGDYMDGIPTVHIMSAVRMNNLKALALMKEGKETEAFAQAYYSVTLGMHIEESYGTLISYLIGNTAKKTGIETLQLLTPEATDVNLLRTYALKLSEAYPSEENLAQCYVVEYHLMSSLIRIITEDPNEVDFVMNNHLQDFEELLYPVFKKVGWSYYYHPNETQNLYYTLLHDRPSGDLVLYPEGSSAYFTENAIGLAVVQALTPRLDLSERWDEEVNLIKDTQAEMNSRAE